MRDGDMTAAVLHSWFCAALHWCLGETQVCTEQGQLAMKGLNILPKSSQARKRPPPCCCTKLNHFPSTGRAVESLGVKSPEHFHFFHRKTYNGTHLPCDIPEVVRHIVQVTHRQILVHLSAANTQHVISPSGYCFTVCTGKPLRPY